MGGFGLDVRRADDLLVLRFEFVNFGLEPDAAAAPRKLIRAAPVGGGPALMIVHFPPQHIAEQVFAVGSLPDQPAPRLLAGPTRLVFRIPPGVDSIPLTLDGLLDWGLLEPVLQQTNPIAVGPTEAVGWSVCEPNQHETAIELPFRLTLSPIEGTRWEHSVAARASGRHVELWRTRLTADTGDEGAEVSAIWSPDFGRQIADPFPQSVSARQRDEIVKMSSLVANIAAFPDSGEWRAWVDQLSASLIAERLMLSALGGWLRIRSEFNVPALPPIFVDSPGGSTELFSLKNWSHTVEMGRDRKVETVADGFLYPFGHRASKLTVTERILEFSQPGRSGRAILVQKSYLTVHEPERAYHDHPSLPFTRIRFVENVTPDLGVEAQVPFVPKVDGVPYGFPVDMTDQSGAVVRAAVGAVWAPAGFSDWDALQRKYDDVNNVSLDHRPVTYTRDRGGNATMTTVAMRLQGVRGTTRSGQPSFLPAMTSAAVRVPALDQFALQTGQREVSIAFHSGYLNAALTERAPGGVFATITNGVDVSVPAGAAGGIVDALGVKLDGLSTEHGIVPNVERFAKGFAATAAEGIEGLDGKLLGQFALTSIIAKPGDAREVPKISFATEGGHRVVKLDWTPKLDLAVTEALPAKLRAAGTPALAIHATIRQPEAVPSLDGEIDLPPASVDVNGTLSGVALVLVDVIEIEFSAIGFRTMTGHKPTFSPHITNVNFIGDLEFVKHLANLLQTAKGGPTVKLTSTGILAEFVLAVPEFGLGLFSLQNLAVSIGVQLHFSDDPIEIRFALSSREHPFLVSYSLFGGGGHLSLLARSDGRIDVDAAIEVGATTSIDLVVAEARAQVLIGLLFATKDQRVTLGGTIRIFGSLDILGLVTVSVDFQLSLTYTAPNATARASLTIAVRVLGFSKSVTLAVERSFNFETFDLLAFGDRALLPRYKSFREGVPLTECWIPYCDAFAVEEH